MVGVKAFLDGVIELHTGWQLEDYADEPGCRGLERFNDHDKMVELIAAADAEGLSVHVHSMGDGATHFMLGCIEDAQELTGDKDQQNVLAHLNFVTDEDIRRMAETRSQPEAHGKPAAQLGSEQAITREQSLRAMTINVACAWHQEHRIGSIEFGKLANMTVYDYDFLHDDIEKVARANLVATIVDGEEVYKA